MCSLGYITKHLHCLMFPQVLASVVKTSHQCWNDVEIRVANNVLRDVSIQTCRTFKHRPKECPKMDARTFRFLKLFENTTTIVPLSSIYVTVIFPYLTLLMNKPSLKPCKFPFLHKLVQKTYECEINGTNELNEKQTNSNLQSRLCVPIPQWSSTIGLTSFRPTTLCYLDLVTPYDTLCPVATRSNSPLGLTSFQSVRLLHTTAWSFLQFHPFRFYDGFSVSKVSS
jgi:hypothetical protein